MRQNFTEEEIAQSLTKDIFAYETWKQKHKVVIRYINQAEASTHLSAKIKERILWHLNNCLEIATQRYTEEELIKALKPIEEGG